MQVAPNAKLIEYLEAQRKRYDTLELKLQQWHDEDIRSAEEREQRDSISHLAEQNRLINSIKGIKLKYEKIPTYSGISNDSLRRLLNGN